MTTLGKITWLSVAAVTVTMLYSCAFPIRVGYDRKSGSYKHVAQASDISYTGEDTLDVASSTAIQAASKAVTSSAPAITETSANNSNLSINKSKDSSATASTVAQAKATSSATSATSATSAATSSSVKKEKATADKSRNTQSRRRGNLEDYAKKWLGAKYVYGAASKSKTDCSGYVMQVYKGFYNIALDHNASSMYKDTRGKSISRKKLKEGDLVFFGGFWRIDHVGIYLKGDRFIHASTSKGVMISPMDDKYWAPKYKGAKRF